MPNAHMIYFTNWKFKKATSQSRKPERKAGESTLKDPQYGWSQNTGEKYTTLKYLGFLTSFEAPHWPSYQTCFHNVKQEGVMERPVDKTGRLFSFKGNLITHLNIILKGKGGVPETFDL